MTGFHLVDCLGRCYLQGVTTSAQQLEYSREDTLEHRITALLGLPSMADRVPTAGGLHLALLERMRMLEDSAAWRWRANDRSSDS